MERNKIVELFDYELNSIKNNNIREYTIKVLENVNDKFFSEPASSTGKYHPNYALGNGGLVRHTKAAIRIFNSLYSLDCIDMDTGDYCRAALILHDTCKSGVNWESKYTLHEHPILVKNLLDKTFNDDRTEEEVEFICTINRLVSSHMGQWNRSKYSDVVLPLPTNRDEIIVHICDYLASRKFLEVNFDILP